MQRRRDLVRSYLARGMTDIEMIDRLSDPDIGLLPPTLTDRQKRDILSRDLKWVKHEDFSRYEVSKEEIEVEKVEYLTRARFLYKEAVEKGDYHLARELSKDIAIIQGVNVNEVPQGEGDIATMLRQIASSRPQQKKLPVAQKVIDGEVEEPPPSNSHIS